MTNENIRRLSKTERAFDYLNYDIFFGINDFNLLKPFSSSGAVGNFEAPKILFKDTRLSYKAKTWLGSERDMREFLRWAIQDTGDLSKGDRNNLPYMDLMLQYNTPDGIGNFHNLAIVFTANGEEGSNINRIYF